MSRSYRKNPIIKYGGWISKREANHKFRQYLKRLDDEGALPKNLSKRITESWDINDIVDRCSKEQAVYWYNYHSQDNGWFQEKYPTLEDYLADWEKWYRRK